MNITGISGAGFKVKTNVVLNETTRYLSLSVPKPTVNTTKNYQFHVELSNLIIAQQLYPDGPLMKDPYITKAVLDIGGVTKEFTGADPWDFTIPVNNTTESLFNNTFYVYPECTNATTGLPFGITHPGTILTIDMKTE